MKWWSKFWVGKEIRRLEDQLRELDVCIDCGSSTLSSLAIGTDSYWCRDCLNKRNKIEAKEVFERVKKLRGELW